MRDSFNFICAYKGCTLPFISLQASDDRRMQIQNLNNAISDPISIMSSPLESLRYYYLLFHILEQEFDGYAGVLVARLYYDAFQICIAHKDQIRASMFADKAFKVRLIYEGDDSPETSRMKSLALNPTAHSSFGVYSNKWQTRRESTPKGLNAMQFSKWLFRQ